jgi:tetratricopeptide (TPR) repeat protein
LDKLVAEFARDPEYRLQLAHRHHDLANLLRANRRPDEAEQGYRQALVLKEKVAADFPANPDYRFHLTQTCLGLASLLIATGQPQEAENLYRRAAALFVALVTDVPANPDYRNSLADCQNTLAWHLVTSPDLTRPLAVEGVERARSATELRPSAGAYWNTLGLAHYRVGVWQEAIDALKKSDELLKGELFSFNAFFLAMAHWQLDKKDEARKSYDQAVEWMEKNKPQDEELQRFRAEAENLIGVKKQQEQ